MRFNIHILIISITCSVVLAFTAATFTHSDLISKSTTLLFFFLSVLMIILHYYYLKTKTTKDKNISSQRRQYSPYIGKAVIFIIGPYAKKWFSQAHCTNIFRSSAAVNYSLIDNIDDLEKQIDYIQLNHPNTLVSGFFPLLSEGDKTDADLIAKLTRWKTTFSCCRQNLSIPCTLAIYARLSNQKLNKVTWLGDFDPLQDGRYSLNKIMSELRQVLLKNSAQSVEQMQRAAMGSNLLNWLEKSQISETISTLFYGSPMRLISVLLSDCNNGVTQQGAWSLWLKKNHHILPAIESVEVIPPLPKLEKFLFTRVSQKVEDKISPPKSTSPRFLWSVWLATGLLVLHIGYLRWCEKKSREVWQDKIQKVNLSSEFDVSQKNQLIQSFEKLQHDYNKQCEQKTHFFSLGKTSCEKLKNVLKYNLRLLNSITELTTANGSILFSKNSAELDTQSKKVLKDIFSKNIQYPNYKLLIIGRADPSGNKQFNKILSAKRADSVKLWLLKNQIVSADKIIIRAAGADEYVDANKSCAGRNCNRRVDIFLLPTILK